MGLLDQIVVVNIQASLGNNHETIHKLLHLVKVMVRVDVGNRIRFDAIRCLNVRN